MFGDQVYRRLLSAEVPEVPDDLEMINNMFDKFVFFKFAMQFVIISFGNLWHTVVNFV